MSLNKRDSIEFVHMTVCGAAWSFGGAEGPAHGWEPSMIFSNGEDQWIPQTCESVVAPLEELCKHGYDGSNFGTSQAFYAWMSEGMPGAVERVFDHEIGEYVTKC